MPPQNNHFRSLNCNLYTLQASRKACNNENCIEPGRVEAERMTGRKRENEIKREFENVSHAFENRLCGNAHEKKPKIKW